MGANTAVPHSPQILVTIEHAAELLETSTRTVRRLIAAGELTPIHLTTRQTRLRLTDLLAYVDRMEQG